jgi:aspartyl protease family protein
MFGLDGDRLMRLLYLVTLLAFMVVWIGLRRRRRQARLRHLAVWAIVVVALVAIYAYRAPFMRLIEPVLAELDPSRVVEVTGPTGERELVVHRGDDGHFRIDAEANGIPVRFLVDTGASSTVLTLADAERAGIDTDSLQFNEPVRTANGLAGYASATLRTLAIGPFRLSSVRIGVMPRGALDTSLLGMSTIDRFSGWRVEGDRMVLVP